MDEQNVTLTNMIIAFSLLFFAILTTATIAIPFTQAIDMKRYVNDQIERYGGLTNDAQNQIKSYSEKNFGGKFTVVSLSGNQKAQFGEEINYKLKGEAEINFFDLPSIPFALNGSASSNVRNER
ncbi:hypothetical protein [Bacillus sp. TE9122W]